MKQIIISPKNMNIMSYIIFFLFLILSILFQYFNFGFIVLRTSLLFIVTPLILMMFHEAFHYVGFLLFPKIQIENLILRPIKPFPVPYITTAIPMNSTTYIYVLLLPTVLLSIFTFIPVILTPNIINSFILATSIGIGAGDILLAIKLLKLERTTMIQTCEEGWGVLVVDNQFEAL